MIKATLKKNYFYLPKGTQVEVSRASEKEYYVSYNNSNCMKINTDIEQLHDRLNIDVSKMRELSK